MDFLNQELALHLSQTESPEAVKPPGRCTGTFFDTRVASLQSLRVMILPDSAGAVKDHWRRFSLPRLVFARVRFR
jgi:hypothetical protein